MADSVNKILWKFFGDTKNLDKALGRSEKGFKATNKASSAMSGALGVASKAAGALGLALGAREVINWAGDAIQLGIAAEEVDSKFKAVYGTAEDFTQALSEWADMAGVTDTAARDMAATFGNLAQAQGVSAKDTEALALEVATLAGDMASFNDSDPAQVFDDLNKAVLTTEREGLKKYGIAVTEAEVKTRAMAIATADGRSEVTQADRSMASYEIVLRQAGQAVGDLERTQHSLANKQRQLKASVKEMQEAFGRELVGALDDAMKGIDGTEVHLEDLGRTAGRVVANGIQPLVGALGDATTAADDSLPMWDRLNAAWRSGYGIMSDMVPPVMLLDSALNTLRGTTERMTGGAERMVEEFDAFPYLQYAQGMRDMGNAAETAAGQISTLAQSTSDASRAASLASVSRFTESGVVTNVNDAQIIRDLIDLGAITGG